MPLLAAVLREHKKNRLLSMWRSVALALSNRFNDRPCVSAGGPVVSVTSHGYRLRHVHLTLESIAVGRLKPGRLLLCLDEHERVQTLTASMRRLQARGMEIMYGPRCGPHQKYFAYVQQADVLDRPLATADDDVLYPRTWLLGMMSAHRRMPDMIHCYRAHRVGLQEGELAAYRSWLPCADTRPSLLNFATGVSGAIYPARFQQWLREQGRAFDTCCPKADDIWLHVNAVRCGMPIAQIHDEPVHFVGTPGTRQGALHRDNVSLGGNEQQLRATYASLDLQRLKTAAMTQSPT